MSAADKPSASMSQTAFARKVGVSRQYIGTLCADGKLPTLPDKSIPMPDGLAAFEAIRKIAPPIVGTVAPVREVSAEENAAHAAAAKMNVDTRGEELRAKRARAALLEVQVKKKRGEVVEVTTVVADARACAEAIRSALLALPPRIASQLEALANGPPGSVRAAAIESLVAGEINAALEVLNGMKFATGGGQ